MPLPKKVKKAVSILFYILKETEVNIELSHCDIIIFDKFYAICFSDEHEEHFKAIVGIFKFVNRRYRLSKPLVPAMHNSEVI